MLESEIFNYIQEKCKYRDKKEYFDGVVHNCEKVPETNIDCCAEICPVLIEVKKIICKYIK